MVDTSSRRNIQSIQVWNRFDPVITNRRTGRTSYMSLFASNYEAEYEAILVGLDLALTLAVTRLEIRSDFQLIIGQIQREYEVKDECMTHYLAMVEDRLKQLDE
ncbi:hypothetical protein VitviT2T_021623 [Vitis vinifera]|uniref:RNase H type-1 domain-containing protein n=1 Tax=Vitis vinifera TaxID=29760 RepID=A0ABY9D7I5_VITVI|nr:hypothetical protein VitviT2T_021623 [Vitis vinifera]